MDNISVVGLGKLGLPLAVCLASRGFNVLGIDKDAKKLSDLNNGILNSTEPGLQNHYHQGKDNFRVSGDVADAIRETNTTFILVGTPSNQDGQFSTCYLDKVLSELLMANCSKTGYHLFIIGSTVMPGTCELVRQTIAETEERERIGLCYCPELVALGNCVDGFLNPDLVVIGESDEKAGDKVAEVYALLSPGTPRARMSLAEAEIFKVALNFFLTMKISFANTLAGICEQYAGANVDRVTNAIGMDSRISPKFLKGGLAFGGFCFPRDVAAFDALCKMTDQLKALPWAVRAVNEYQKVRLYAEMDAAGDGPVSVLGLSFKPGTPEIEASPAVDLVDKLRADGRKVRVYDPLATYNLLYRWNNDVGLWVDSVTNLVNVSPIVVIATDDPLWKTIGPADFQHGANVIDCWRCLSEDVQNAPHINYRAIGVGQ